MTESEAHDAILSWCRSKPRGHSDPCMRITHPSEGLTLYTVVDVSRTEPVPGSTWERRNKRIAAGNTWCEIAVALGITVKP